MASGMTIGLLLISRCLVAIIPFILSFPILNTTIGGKRLGWSFNEIV